jgi:hypothetical protein
MTVKLIKQKIYLIFIVFALVGCKRNSNYENYKIVETILIKSTDQLPDSTFMSGAWGMQFVDNYIFFVESHSRQLIRLAADFSENSRISAIGQGPREVIDPGNFFIHQDTIHIRDGVVIKSFTMDNKFIRSFNPMHISGRSGFSFFSRNRGFFRDNILYVSAFDRGMNTSMSRIYLDRNDNAIELFGQSFEFDTPMQTFIRNGRHLLDGGDFFYTVSDNLPVIEKYCFCCHSLLETFDYSFVPIVRDNLRTIASRHQNDNQYTLIVGDSYIYDASIFLLVSSQREPFRENTILKINLNPKFKPEKIYLLPGEVYSIFSIGSGFIFAFNVLTASIEKIKME